MRTARKIIMLTNERDLSHSHWNNAANRDIILTHLILLPISFRHSPRSSQNKIDLNSVSGTGNFGRVTVGDVKVAMGEKPAKKAGASGPSQVSLPSGVVPYTGMQRAVSTNMEATLSVPIFRVSRTIEMDAFNALYQSVKPKGVTLSALITKAVAMAVEKHPIMNAAHDAGAPGIK